MNSEYIDDCIEQEVMPQIDWHENRIPLEERKLYFSDRINNSYEPDQDDRSPATTMQLANLISSESIEHPGRHLPVIDLDVPHLLVPSTTDGHSHLYLDVACSWDNYVNLLRAMANCGIVERGYVNASIERGFTSVRLPWITKET